MPKDWSMQNHPPMPKPKDDDGYLEKMSLVIFVAGLNWNVIEAKWPDIKKLFVNFSLEKVAKMNAFDKKELMEDKRVIRNLRKIEAVIKNAQALIAVKKEFGSIENYLKITKKQGEEILVKELGKRFSFLGPSTALMFLHAVGIEMPEMMKAKHG